MLFLYPDVGVMILVIALVATLFARAKDRERKHAGACPGHREERDPPPPPPPASTPERLAEMNKLKESGAITEEGYETKRRDILDSL